MAVVLSLLALAGGGALVVQRTPDAYDCPDAAALAVMIGKLTNKGPEPADAATVATDRFDVEFSRATHRYRVVVRTRGARTGVRTLDDAGATCASLAEATALTIAVIVDPEGVKLPEPVEAAAPPFTEPAAVSPPPADASPPATAAPAGSDSTSSRWSLAIETRGGAALGVVREMAPVALVDVAVRPSRLFSFDAGALFIPTQSLALERGTIDVWLLAATANACVWPYAERVRVGGCLGVAAGSIRGEGRGFPVSSAASRAWLAATGAAKATGPIVGPLGWSAQAGLVVPSHRESFGIEGAGVAYQSPSVAGILAVGLTLTIR